MMLRLLRPQSGQQHHRAHESEWRRGGHASRRPVADSPLDDVSLNGIAISTDGHTIYASFVGPGKQQGGVIALPAF